MALAILAGLPSWAGEAECKAVAASLVQMAEQPIVRQTDTRPDFPGPITMIFAQSAMYVSAGGAWKTMDVTAARRVMEIQTLLKMTPLTECRLDATEDVDGTATFKYDYQQGPEKAQIWVGTSDGLPYRFQSGGVLSKIEYVGVVVPIP